ncbi:MAG: NAD-dependent succinate-semialdehyde dehydrogenase [Thermoanaerobaculia bacterium]
MSIASINPATDETLEVFEPLTPEGIDRAIGRGAERFRSWRLEPFSSRSEKMRRAGRILEDEADRWGRLMSLEMGKPIQAAISEAKKCAWVCRYYADHAEEFLADETIATDARQSFVRYQPLGVVLAIMPWNFPFWQVFRFVAPGLMAGNVGLLKHSSNVPQCAMAIEEILLRAGFPEGCFQTLLIGSSQVRQLLEDSRIAAATLTGSEPAGRNVAEIAGRQLKKVVLELGGSDPFIIMPSADLDAAAKVGVSARTINNGQSCIAAKRFIVHREIADRYIEQFVERMRTLKIGDPLEPGTDIGPLATRQIAEELQDQVKRSVDAGARLLLGGKIVDRPGNFFEPTVLVDVPRDSAAACEELFGPVAAFFRVANAEEALEVANDTRFGLGSAAWTNDPGEQKLFIDGIAAGQVFINSMVASDPRLPFGGIKHSGYGRELGVFGIREFVNVKSVSIAQVAPDVKAKATE